MADFLSSRDHAQRSAVPDGYVLMPREATRAMTMAACDSLPSCEHVFGHAGEMLRNCYRKMVAVVDSSTDRAKDDDIRALNEEIERMRAAISSPERASK